MKALKIICLVLLVLVVSVVIGAIVFLKTFDLNKLLPQITQEASKAMGREVTIEAINLNLTLSGITLDLGNVVIANEAKVSNKPFVRIPQVNLALDIWPLISTRALLVKSIGVGQAELNYVDVNPQLPLNISVKNINVAIRDFSLTKSFSFKADASLLSAQNNIQVKGDVLIDMAAMGARVSNLLIKTDLAQVELTQLGAVTPILGQVPMPTKLQGQLNVMVSKVDVSPKGAADLEAQVILSDGMVAFDQFLLSALTQLKAKADLDLKDIHLKELSFMLAGGSVVAHGDLSDYTNRQLFKMDLNLDGIKAEELIEQKTWPLELKGRVAGRVDVAGEGFTPAGLSRHLKGSGEFVVKEGIIERLNLVKAILGSTLSVVPGLADSIDNLLSGALKEKVGGDTTVLDKAELKFTVEEGILHVDEGVVSSKIFDVTLQGMMNDQLKVDMRTVFQLAEDVSASLADQVNELNYLMDDSKRITVAASIAGVVPALVYKPDVDLKKVASNALIEEGSKQLQKVIEKNPEVGSILNAVFGGKQNQDGDSTDQDQQPADNAAPSQEKTKKIINDVLGNFLK